MRIDEFSNSGDIDGVLLSTEQTRFMLFGFDLPPGAPAAVAEFIEEIIFNSLITFEIVFNSLITKAITFNSIMTENTDLDSPLGD